MGKYEADLAKVVAGRQELANAEKLLDQPVTMYPEVISMQKDMKGLRQIYDVYKAQKVRYGGCQLKITIRYWDTLLIIPVNIVFQVCPVVVVTSFRMQSQSGLRPCGWT